MGGEERTTSGGPPRAPAKRPLTRTTRIGTALILTLALLEGAGLAVRYYLTDHRFVITDNAKVDGDQVEIRAPAEGRVIDWRVDTGSTLTADQVVGRVQLQGGTLGPRMPIRSPGPGTVVQNTVSNGMYVDAGALLATAYDLGRVHVTARVREEDVAGVRLGAPVDVYVDADGSVPLAGTVSAIAAAAAGVNQLSGSPSADPLDLDHPVYPGSDTDPQNPQTVQQYVPVTILLTAVGDARTVPGQNVTVHIHRQ